MKTYKIEIANDTNEADKFCAFLNSLGHDAIIGNSTGNYINGECTSYDVDANEIYNNLWNQYCK